MKVAIDRSTGELILDSQKLGGNLEEAEFLRSAVGSTAKKIQSSGSRNYYESWQQVDPKLEIGITARFQPGGSLERITAKFVKAEMRSTPWSKDMEEDIKRFHEQLAARAVRKSSSSICLGQGNVHDRAPLGFGKHFN